MAPSDQSQIDNHSDQPPHNPPPSNTSKTPHCGTSKAQLSLQKILHTILTIPNNRSSSPLPSSLKNDVQNQNQYVPPPANTNLSADEGLAANLGNEGYNMGLLIEAAKMIFGESKEEEKLTKSSFGDFNDDSKRVNKRRKRGDWRTVDLCGDMEVEVEPAVRSNRERTRVLPCKYRDSVLEPLTRLPRNRSTAIIPKKRRLR
ncbi:hypothetical protein ACH5RR_009750 [Cinchona calisaya]|uniref:Uncharacterized protein n=1 Tax=Cinchona calisaya TaxID=153742 RepID=A0ABD3AFW4_9GENT